MDNLRGAILMTAAMLGFACGDLFIKLMTETLPNWQIITLMGLCGGAVFAAALLTRREALLDRAMLTRAILVRNAAELVGTVCFVTALSMTSFSLSSVILQTTPLIVTMGAALVLKEHVGWRRWSAICAGFAGVLLVMRPSPDGVDTGALFALLAVCGLAVRDLSTRAVPRRTSTLQLSFLGFATLVPAGLVLSLTDPRGAVAMAPSHWAMLAAAVGLLGLAYVAIVSAMRIGEVSFVTPFRYTRIVFALFLGAVVFGDTFDLPMLAGSAVIVGSGLFTVWRERKIRTTA